MGPNLKRAGGKKPSLNFEPNSRHFQKYFAIISFVQISYFHQSEALYTGLAIRKRHEWFAIENVSCDLFTVYGSSQLLILLMQTAV